jgi:radical SAM family uncharacterized protein/radical SAM-linked protein
MNSIMDNPDLVQVEKPARYVNGEWNAVNKIIPDNDCSFVLAFPDSYEIAQSGMGFKILYSIINNHQRASAQRVCAPLPDMENYLLNKNLELFSLETGKPLREFDIIGFTLQYQMTYTNILNMLSLGGVPIYSNERNADDPLVIAGGPGAFAPEPVAEFFDVIFIGDGENGITAIIDRYLEWKDGDSRDRQELLRSLSEIQGVYVPSFYRVNYNNDNTIDSFEPVFVGLPRRISRSIVKNLDDAHFPCDTVVPFLQTIHDRVMLEVFRGCTRGCRFCQAGFIYRPVRERSEERILRLADCSLKSTGYDEISLLALSCTDYSRISSLLEKLSSRYGRQGVTVSLPSLRMDTSALELARLVESSRKSGLTFAPEAGSQRLRDVINKNITEDDIFNTISQAKKLGWNLVKLYFMIGLPTETDDDIDEMIDLVHRIRKEIGIKLNVSISHFVPQPFTPFQWDRMESIENLKRKSHKLKDSLRHRLIQVSYHEPSTSFLEGVFVRGDRRLSRVIEKAFKMGARFDGWSEYFDFSTWLKAFEECGIDPGFYLKEKSFDQNLPWDIIDSGVLQGFLREEKNKAQQGITTPDCRGTCIQCGVCPVLKVSSTFTDPAEAWIDQGKTLPDIHGRVRKIRLRVSKRGVPRWVSHLDMQRTVERSIRRGGIPVSYSEGFHPRPRISFVLPLPLGYTSESEWFEIILYEPRNADEISLSLNSSLPEGIRVLEAREVPLDEKSITSYTLKAVYSISLPGTEKIDRNKISLKLEEFRTNEELILSRGEKIFNARPMVSDIKLLSDSFPYVLGMDIIVKPTGSVKPSEIIEHLFGSGIARNSGYHRKELLVEIGNEYKSP